MKTNLEKNGSDIMRKMNSEQIIEYIRMHWPTDEEIRKDLHRWIIEANRVWKEKSPLLSWSEQVNLAKEIEDLKKIIGSVRRELSREDTGEVK